MIVGIKEATRAATRNMIEFLCAEKGLTREEAYMLCSVAGDLRMHEVVRFSDALLRCVQVSVLILCCVQVDMPNYVVRFLSRRGPESFILKSVLGS